MKTLELQNISHSYAQPDTRELKILDGISLQLGRGESVSITGPSGSGKSTLLYIAGTLLKQTAGVVLIDGIKTADITPDEISLLRNKKIGFIFQQHFLLPQLTALENVLLPQLAKKNTINEEIINRAQELFIKSALKDRMKHYPADLSAGECQRVACLRALLHEPLLILADEPTGSLDQKNAQIILEMLFSMLSIQNSSLLLVTHSEKAAAMCSRNFLLENGVIRQS